MGRKTLESPVLPISWKSCAQRCDTHPAVLRWPRFKLKAHYAKICTFEANTVHDAPDDQSAVGYSDGKESGLAGSQVWYAISDRMISPER